MRSYLNEKSSGSRSRKQRLTAVGTSCADHVTPLYPQKLALTSPTGGGRSLGIVRVRTKATELYTLRFFSLQNAVCFINLTYLFPVLFTFYAKGVLKLKNNSGAKGLKHSVIYFVILIWCCGSLSCVVCESYGVHLRPAVDVLVVRYTV